MLNQYVSPYPQSFEGRSWTGLANVVRKSLRKNFSWALNGAIFYVFSQWVLLIILAKLGGSAIVGRYTLGLAITAPIVLLSNLQLRALLASDVQENFPFSVYATLRCLTSLGALLLICGLTVCLEFTIDQALVISLIGIAKVIESGSDITYGLMQKHERMDLVCLSKGIRGILTAVVFGGIFGLSKSLIAGVGGMVAVWFIVFILFDCRHLQELLGNPGNYMSWPQMAPASLASKILSLSKFSLPLGMASMLMSYNTAMPRYLLEIYHGEAALGYFSAIACFTVACTIVPEAFSQAALPRLAKYYANALKSYWRLLGKLMLVAFLIGMVGIIVATLRGSELLRFVYKEDFGTFSYILVLIMVLGATESICSVLGVGMTAARRLAAQLPVLVGTLIITTVSGWLLIPSHAMQGAVLASIVGMVAWGGAYFLILTVSRDVSIIGQDDHSQSPL